MHFTYGGEVDFVAGYGYRLEVQGVKILARRRRRIRGGPQGHDRERELPQRVQPQQFADRVVLEAGGDSRRNAARGAYRQRVRQYRTAVPKGVAVLPRLVLAGVAPGHVSEDDCRRRGGNPRLAACGVNDGQTVVALPQQVQRRPIRVKVIHTRVQALNVTAYHVKFDMEQRARAGSGAKRHRPAGAPQCLRDAGGVM